MVRQDYKSERTYGGPWRGLNTTSDPLQIGEAWAAEAYNVILSEGRLQPGPLWSLSGALTIPGHLPVGMFHWDRLPASDLPPQNAADHVILLKTWQGGTTNVGKLWAVRINASHEAVVVELAQGLSQHQPTWVVANNLVYVLDGSERPVKTDGTPEGTKTIGIEPPSLAPSGQVSFTLVNSGLEQGNLALNSTYRVAVTFYDADTDVESNPLVHEFTTDAVQDQLMRVSLLNDASPPAGRGITHFRVYLALIRDDTGDQINQPLYLYRQVDAGGLETYIRVFTETTTGEPFAPPEAGNAVSGPFAPSLNGLPPAARVGHMYRDRMFYSDPEDDRKLWFSAAGHPDHVASDAWLPLQGDANDSINGMAELGGQLFVLKFASIWGVHGGIEVATNADAALGNIVVPILPEIYRTRAAVGCANAGGGNGAIVLGHPPLIYFNGVDGWFAFDGSDTRMVSSAILPTWRKFVEFADLQSQYFRVARQQSISYGVDAGRQLVFMACRQIDPDDGAANPSILCYHYGGPSSGAWTVLGHADGGAPSWPVPVCCTSLGWTWGGAIQQAGPMVVAQQQPFPQSWHVLTARFGHDGDEIADSDPRFSRMVYRTGRIQLSAALAALVYRINWVVGRTPDGSQVLLAVGHDADGAASPTYLSKAIGGRSRFTQPVGRTCDDLTLYVEMRMTGANFRRTAGLLGWSIDVERSGQR